VYITQELMRPLSLGTVEIAAQNVCNMRLKVNRILNRKEEEDEASGLSTNDEKDLLRIDNGCVGY
jgi:hypothetical protein